MDETCFDKECRYFKEEYDKQNDVWDFYSYCERHKKFIPEEKEKLCEYYLKSKLCYNCLHKNTIVYETGTIDDIEYRCKLQNNKLIYDDLNPYIMNYADFPDCPIDKWENKRL